MTRSSPPALEPLADTTWRTRNLGALLYAATDRSVRDKLRVMHGRGFGHISEAQLAIFHHLEASGTRVTVIAARSNLTKQSVIELVDRAEMLGFVERCPHPIDRRAKNICLTPRGLDVVQALEQGIAVAEQHVVQLVGHDFLVAMKRALVEYVASADDGVSARTDLPWREIAVGRLLAMSARRFAAQALGVAQRRGQEAVGEVLLALFRNLDLDGTRLTVLAMRARVTKQSMRELVDRAEALGLVERTPDPLDGRAKIIRFTDAGLKTLDDLRHGVEYAEAQFGQLTGAAFLARIKKRLSAYAITPIHL